MKEIIVNVDNYNENSIKTIEGDNLNEVYKIYICKNKRRIDLTNKIAIMAYVNEYGSKKSNILALNITNASQGEIELPITNVISSENGVYACQIAIYGENNSLEQTAPFSLIVENNIFSKISNTAINSSDFHILSEAIKTTNTYREKLKQGTENIELQYADKLNEVNSQLAKKANENEVVKRVDADYFDNINLEKLKEVQTKDTITFLWFSDIHQVYYRNKTALSILNKITKEVDVDFITCTGDLIQDDRERNICYDNFSQILRGIDNKFKFFPIKGNHDENSHTGKGFGTKETIISNKDFYIRMLKHLGKEVKFDEENPYGLYYYYDDVDSKTRFIFLNSMDKPFEWNEDGTFKYPRWYFGFSQEQLNWVWNKALVVPDNEWKVAFFTHSSMVLSNKIVGKDNIKIENADTLITSIKKFRDGGADNYDYVDSYGRNIKVKYDFQSKENRGKVLGCFFGHYHADNFFVDDYNINHIGILNNYPGQEPGTPAREKGTITELVVDICTIDTVNNKMYFNRIGAGQDREITYII